MKAKFLGLLMLVGVSFIAISQNETVEGDLTVDGDILKIPQVLEEH